MFLSKVCNLSFLSATASLLLMAAPCTSVAQTAPSDLSLHDNDAQVLPPTQVRCGLKSNYVEVTWNNVADDLVSEYHVFRYDNSDPNNSLRDIAIVPRTTRANVMVHYKDYTIQGAKAYTYFVTSKTSFGNQSINSNNTQIATPAQIPH